MRTRTRRRGTWVSVWVPIALVALSDFARRPFIEICTDLSASPGGSFSRRRSVDLRQLRAAGESVTTLENVGFVVGRAEIRSESSHSLIVSVLDPSGAIFGCDSGFSGGLKQTRRNFDCWSMPISTRKAVLPRPE